jgi:hypothetical protein
MAKVVITMCDGESLYIKEDTVINGYETDKEEFYLSNVYSNSLNNQLGLSEPCKFATTNPMVGVSGFLGTVDYFSIGNNTEDNILYRTSAIKSIKNHIVRPIRVVDKRTLGL